MVEEIERFYTGVGAREIPNYEWPTLRAAGRNLAEMGWTLRSGACFGGDMQFEIGCDYGKGKKQIFLPFKDYNDQYSIYQEPKPEAFKICKRYLPHWDSVKRDHQKFIARSAHEVLGPDLDAPSTFMLCWTKAGAKIGSTGSTIRIAEAYNVPVFNLGGENPNEIMEKLEKYL